MLSECALRGIRRQNVRWEIACWQANLPDCILIGRKPVNEESGCFPNVHCGLEGKPKCKMGNRLLAGRKRK